MSENIGYWTLLWWVSIQLWDKWPKCLSKNVTELSQWKKTSTSHSTLQLHFHDLWHYKNSTGQSMSAVFTSQPHLRNVHNKCQYTWVKTQTTPCHIQHSTIKYLITEKNIHKQWCSADKAQTNKNTSYFGMILNQAIFTHIDSVFKAKKICYFSLWTFAQTHIWGACWLFATNEYLEHCSAWFIPEKYHMHTKYS